MYGTRAREQSRADVTFADDKEVVDARFAPKVRISRTR